MKKTLIVPVLAATILGGALVTASSAQAFWGGQPIQGEFAKTLATHLGVSEDSVKGALSKMHEERHQNHVTSLTARLDALVAEGKLTEAQKTAVLAKFSEMHQEKMTFSENGDAPENRAERREAIEAKKAELDAWAEEQGIDLSLFMPAKIMMKQ